MKLKQSIRLHTKYFSIKSILSLLITFLVLTANAQPEESSYLHSIKNLYSSFSEKQKAECSFDFNDPHRTQWSRLPGNRKGLKLTAFSQEQKTVLHRLLRRFFPSQGYLKVTSIMFNEDIQKKNEPELGRNEYWFSFFGEAVSDKQWGWKLEGHHLSINMTLKGDQLISFTPVTFATNPAITHSDGERDGLAILYQEEELARQLINSFSDEQLIKGYSDRKKPKAVYGELNENLQDIPDEGIPVADLNQKQRAILKSLVAEYIQNFNTTEVPTIGEILDENARFFFLGSKVHGKAHYYKIENGQQFIEYENYDNHIHFLWRNYSDYGKGSPGSIGEIEHTREQAIQALIDDYAKARETKDTDLLQRILMPEVDQLVSSGEWRVSIEESLKGMLRSSANNPGSRMLKIDKMRFLNSESGIVDARYEIQNADGSLRKMWSTFIVVYNEGRWKIAGIRNMLPARRQ